MDSVFGPVDYDAKKAEQNFKEEYGAIPYELRDDCILVYKEEFGKITKIEGSIPKEDCVLKDDFLVPSAWICNLDEEKAYALIASDLCYGDVCSCRDNYGGSFVESVKATYEEFSSGGDDTAILIEAGTRIKIIDEYSFIVLDHGIDDIKIDLRKFNWMSRWEYRRENGSEKMSEYYFYEHSTNLIRNVLDLIPYDFKDNQVKVSENTGAIKDMHPDVFKSIKEMQELMIKVANATKVAIHNSFTINRRDLCIDTDGFRYDDSDFDYVFGEYKDADVEQIVTASKHRCFIIHTTNNQHILYIPNDVTKLNESYNNLTVTKHLRDFDDGDLTVIGGTNLQDVQYLFVGISLERITIKLDSRKYTTLRNMFYECESKEIYLDTLDTSNVTDMKDMFKDCESNVVTDDEKIWAQLQKDK